MLRKPLALCISLATLAGCEHESTVDDAAVGLATASLTAAPITATHDTTLRSSVRYANDGTGARLGVSAASVAGLERSLLRFDTSDIHNAVAGQTLHRATVTLSVASWQTEWLGGQIEILPMTEPWVEGNGRGSWFNPGSGPSWVCRHDNNTSFFGNFANHCSTGDDWGMLPTDSDPMPFATTATDIVPVFTGLGTVEFDVTADVAAYLSGDADNHGWILRGTHTFTSGELVQFDSSESGNPPVLNIEYGNDGCPADPLKGAPGACGCGVSDADLNNDGVADCVGPVLEANADTTVRLAVPFGNDGTGALLGVTSVSVAGLERSMVRFDQAEIEQAVGNQAVVSAKLQMTVAGVALGWGGGTLAAHAMTRDWPEGNGLAGHGPSWFCRDDTNTTLLGLLTNNCAPGDAWAMSPVPGVAAPYDGFATDSVQTFATDRVVTFDVTADVVDFIHGSKDNNGWLIKGEDALLSGEWINFGSRESGTPPRLVFELQSACTAGCPASANPCVDSFCDERTGQCRLAPKDGATCDDGDPSTTDDICVAGGCQGIALAGVAPEQCAAQHVYEHALRTRPDFVDERKKIARGQAGYAAQREAAPIDNLRTGVVQIPVVVHVIGDQAMVDSVDIAQIDAQLDTLNEDYRRLSGGTVPAQFQPFDSDLQLEFVRARRSPMCTASNGRTESVQAGDPTWCADPQDATCADVDAMKKSATVPCQGAGCMGTQTGVDPWDTDQYLNIWVVNLTAGLLGVAQFPGDDPATDGVILDVDYFGPTADSSFGLGRTLTHEVGHYLGLLHTFQQSWVAPYGQCNGSAPAGDTNGTNTGTPEGSQPGLDDACDLNGDLVCDTPPQTQSSSGCPAAGTNTCNHSSEVPDLDNMTMNYMDYSDDACMAMFSAGQKVIVDFTMNNFRQGLRNSAGLVPPPPVVGPDLWIADGNDDVGNEPNTETGKMYKSDDIWVRHNHDEFFNEAHQNPLYLAPGETTPDGSDHNHVYVNVRNRGCGGATEPSYVDLYWAKAGTNLSWPDPWDGSRTIPDALGGDDVAMGGYVDFKEVGALAEGQFDILKFDWTVPNPASYADIGGDETHFCLLAAVDPCTVADYDDVENLCPDTDGDGDGGEMPSPLVAGELSRNVKNNNNIAWKNVSVTGAAAVDGSRGASVTIGGNADGSDVRLVLEEPEEPARADSVFDWGSVRIDLGPELLGRWQAEGSQGTGVTHVPGTTELVLSGSGAVVSGLPMQSVELFTVAVRFVPMSGSEYAPQRVHPDAYVIDLEQFRGSTFVGGESFVLKTFRPPTEVIVPQ